MGKLSGKVAAITGGASGIGLEIATLFAAEGAAVAVLDINGARAKEVATGLAKSGAKSLGVACDVADEAAVTAAFKEIVTGLGEVDILVSNAGHDDTGPIATMPVAQWDRMFAVHARGVFLCARAVLPAMLATVFGHPPDDLFSLEAPMRTMFGLPLGDDPALAPLRRWRDDIYRRHRGNCVVPV